MPKNRTIPRACEACGKVFPSHTWRALTGYVKHCSNACRYGAATVPVEQRFWRYVDPVEREGCWPWTASVNQEGYGLLRLGGSQRSEKAHRLAWQIATGAPVPDGMMVCHTCDLRHCVRNDDPGIYVIRGIARPRYGHLWLGTNLDNVTDMLLKERSLRGEAHLKVKLSDDDVREIRRSHAEDGKGYRRLARERQLGTATVQQIIQRKTWRHLL